MRDHGNLSQQYAAGAATSLGQGDDPNPTRTLLWSEPVPLVTYHPENGVTFDWPRIEKILEAQPPQFGNHVYALAAVLVAARKAGRDA